MFPYSAQDHPRQRSSYFPVMRFELVPNIGFACLVICYGIIFMHNLATIGACIQKDMILMNLALTSTKRLIHRTIAHVVSVILRPGAVYDLYNFRLWEKRGYHITPVHFYHPIPNTSELERTYPMPTSVPGVDLRPDFQVELLEKVFPQFAAEYDAFPSTSQKPGEFYLDNDSFGGIDPHVYYSLLEMGDALA